MAVLDRAAIKAAIDLLITTNGTKAISGALHNTLLNDIADSLTNNISDVSLIGLNVYDVSTTYDTGRGVFFEGGLYRADQDGISGVFDPLKWTLIAKISSSSDFDFVDYDNGTTYNIGDRVLSLERFFICDINGTVGILPDDSSANWTEVSANNGVFANEWVAGFYIEGQIVQRNNLLYKLTATTPPSFDSTDIDAEITGGDWVLFHDVGSLSAVDVKTLYESNADTNEFTDSEKTNVSNLSGTNSGDESASSELGSGIIEIATQAEVNTGTDDLRSVTALKLTTLLNALLPSGGSFIPIIVFENLIPSLSLIAGDNTLTGSSFTILVTGTYLIEYGGTCDITGDTTVTYSVREDGSQVGGDTIRTLSVDQGGGSPNVSVPLHIKSRLKSYTAGQVIDIRANLIAGTATANAGSITMTRIS